MGGSPIEMGADVHDFIQGIQPIASDRNGNFVVRAEVSCQGGTEIDDGKKAGCLAAIGTLIGGQAGTHVVADHLISGAGESPTRGAVTVLIGAVAHRLNSSFFELVPKPAESTTLAFEAFIRPLDGCRLRI